MSQTLRVCAFDSSLDTIGIFIVSVAFIGDRVRVRRVELFDQGAKRCAKGRVLANRD